MNIVKQHCSTFLFQCIWPRVLIFISEALEIKKAILKTKLQILV